MAKIYVVAAQGIPWLRGTVSLRLRDGFLLFSHVERKVRLHSTCLLVPLGERRKRRIGVRESRVCFGRTVPVPARSLLQPLRGSIHGIQPPTFYYSVINCNGSSNSGNEWYLPFRSLLFLLRISSFSLVFYCTVLIFKIKLIS